VTSIELVKRAKKLTATSILMLGLIAAIVFFVAPVLKTTFFGTTVQQSILADIENIDIDELITNPFIILTAAIIVNSFFAYLFSLTKRLIVITYLTGMISYVLALSIFLLVQLLQLIDSSTYNSQLLQLGYGGSIAGFMILLQAVLLTIVNPMLNTRLLIDK